MQLGCQHYDRENGKKQRLEYEEEQEHNGDWRRKGRTAVPLMFDAPSKLINRQKYCVQRYEGDVEGEQNKHLLIFGSHTIVDPWTAVKRELIRI